MVVGNNDEDDGCNGLNTSARPISLFLTLCFFYSFFPCCFSSLSFSFPYGGHTRVRETAGIDVVVDERQRRGEEEQDEDEEAEGEKKACKR